MLIPREKQQDISNLQRKERRMTYEYDVSSNEKNIQIEIKCSVKAFSLQLIKLTVDNRLEPKMLLNLAPYVVSLFILNLVVSFKYFKQKL